MGVDWKCVDDRCSGVLGRTVKGELVIDGVRANTDGASVIVYCPVCGRPKVWWVKDRAVLAAASSILSDKVDKLISSLTEAQ